MPVIQSLRRAHSQPVVRLATLFALNAFSAFSAASGQPQARPDPSLLTVERIFNSRDFRGQFFGQVRWLDDSTYTAVEPGPEGKGTQLMRVDAATGRKEVLVPVSALLPAGAKEPIDIEDYDWNDAHTRLLIFTNSARVWRENTRGDFWVLDLASKKLRQLGGAPAKAKPSTLQFAKFSPDGKHVAFVREHNIYVEPAEGGPNGATGSIVALTRDGSNTTINGTFDWVYEEELYMRDGFRWSPDGNSIAFWQLDSRGVRDFHMINNTDSLYPRVITYGYPKVGETNSACRVGIVPASGGPVRWLDIPGDPRNTYIPRMEWADDSHEVILQHLNRLQNRNDVLLGDAGTGGTRIVFTERDSAWVDVMDDLFWTGGGKYFTWVSERDGWRHVYLVPRTGTGEKPLTRGEFDVIDVAGVDGKGGWLYYIASPDNPTQRYLYRVRLDGKGGPERLTPPGDPGTHSYQASPSMRWAFHTHSTINKPDVTDLVSLPGHRGVRMLRENRELTRKVNGLRRRPAEFFRVDIGGGVLLDGWCLKPPDFDSTKIYPLLFYVYGEPAGQTVLDRWDGNLWPLMLSQQGYVIASVDNRGTPAPRGRQWRKIIYRQVGILASADQAAAARALIRLWPFVDSSRIGIWGWSGGGSMTLNAMFRYPDLYRTGLAIAFVSNQRYYDDVYQERYMGLPEDNEKGFTEGSPITYAKDLKGNLLIVAGTGDDNVHYQNCEALINELVANNKHFSMLSYPNRSHGIYEGRGTTRHLYESLTYYLKENLPPGPRDH